MCDTSDIKLAEVKMIAALRCNDLNAATKCWDTLTAIKAQYDSEHNTQIPA